MTLPNYPPLVWLLIIGVGGFLAWFVTRGTGGTVPAGGLNNGKS